MLAISAEKSAKQPLKREPHERLRLFAVSVVCVVFSVGDVNRTYERRVIGIRHVTVHPTKVAYETIYLISKISSSRRHHFFLLVLLLVFVWCSSGTPIRMRRSLVLIALANRLSGSDCLNWVKAKQHRVETWDPSKGILIKNQRIGRNVYSFVYCIHTIKHYMIFPRFNFTTFYYTNLIECVYVLYVYRRGETRIIGHLRWITNSQSI